MALIDSCREVVKHGGYDYVILCSGQDLIVRQNIDEFLTQNYGQIYIDSWEDDKTRRAFLLYKWPKKYFRIIDKKVSVIRAMRVLRIKLFQTGLPFGKRKINFDTSKMVFYKNWFWSCLPFDFVEWMTEFLRKTPEYVEVFKGFVAEEGFLATTIMLSPYKDRLQFDTEGKSHSLTFRKPSINNHPPVLTVNDIPEIESSGCYFARKFDENVDNNVIDYFMKKSEDCY